MKKTCLYANCKKEFESKRSDKKFCSNTCRSKHTHMNMAKRELGMLEPLPTAAAPSFGNNLMQLPPHAQFMVDFQTKEAKRWEDAFKEERELRKKLKEANEALNNELRELRTQQQIKESSVPQKNMLDGIMENEHVMKYLGPVIGRLAESVIPGAGPTNTPEIAGVDAETQNRAVQMINWYAQQPKEAQELFYAMVDRLAANREASALINQLKQIIHMVNQTSMKPNYNHQANANAGY